MNSIVPEYEIKELPSRLIGYPQGTKIFAKPYTFGAAMNLSIVGHNNISTLSEVLDGVRVDGMPKNLITPQDILFLGVYRNLMSSIHDKINIKSTCPKCLKETVVQKTLGSIQFKAIEDFDAEHYPLEVDLDNYTMWFGFVSYKDYEFCLQKYRGNKLYQLALQVIKYKNKETNEVVEKPEYNAKAKDKKALAAIELYIEETRKVLFSMVDEDKDALDEVVKILENYGLKPIEVTCSDELCKHEYTIEFDDDNVLVTPFRNPEKSARDRIKLRRNEDDRPDIPETDEPKRS